MDQRKIIHIDMDAFFASVEQRDFPELRGKPVVVGGRPGGRGVIAAASYEARRFGVRSAMPSNQAQRLCPHLIFVRSRFDVYRSVSRQIRDIFGQYTDLVEPLSLDEAFLDVTENKKDNPSATWVANEIRRKIWDATSLTASAGVAHNKFLAKIASDVNKPNGICVITPDKAEAFLEQLPIGKFYGIGKATEKRMHELGIYTGTDLKRWEELELVRHFGKTGAFYYRIVRGRDDRIVSPFRLRKSVGVEETYSENLTTSEALAKELETLAKTLEGRLHKAELSGKTITLKLRYIPFETLTRARTLERFVNDADTLRETAISLMRNAYEDGKGVRLLGITVSNLDNQPDLSHEFQIPLPLGEEWL